MYTEIWTSTLTWSSGLKGLFHSGAQLEDRVRPAGQLERQHSQCPGFPSVLTRPEAVAP